MRDFPARIANQPADTDPSVQPQRRKPDRSADDRVDQFPQTESATHVHAARAGRGIALSHTRQPAPPEVTRNRANRFCPGPIASPRITRRTARSAVSDQHTQARVDHFV